MVIKRLIKQPENHTTSLFSKKNDSVQVSASLIFTFPVRSVMVVVL